MMIAGLAAGVRPPGRRGDLRSPVRPGNGGGADARRMALPADRRLAFRPGGGPMTRWNMQTLLTAGARRHRGAPLRPDGRAGRSQPRSMRSPRAAPPRAASPSASAPRSRAFRSCSRRFSSSICWRPGGMQAPRAIPSYKGASPMRPARLSGRPRRDPHSRRPGSMTSLGGASRSSTPSPIMERRPVQIETLYSGVSHPRSRTLDPAITVGAHRLRLA